MPTIQNFVQFGGDANEAVNAAKQYGAAVDRASQQTVKLGKTVEKVFPEVERQVMDSAGNMATAMVTPFRTMLEGVTTQGAKFKRTIDGVLGDTRGQFTTVTTEIISDLDKLEARVRKFQRLTAQGAISAGEDKYKKRNAYIAMFAGLLDERDAEDAKKLEESRKAGLAADRRRNKERLAESKSLMKALADYEESLRKEAIEGIRAWSRAKKQAAREEAQAQRELYRDGLEGIRAWSRAKKQAAREEATAQAQLYRDAIEGIRQWSRAKKQAERETNRTSALGAGDEMIGLLGGVSPQATLAGRASLSSISTSLEGMIAKGKLSRKTMMELFEAVKYNTLEAFKLKQANGQLSLEMKQAESAIRRLLSAHHELNRAGVRTSEILMSWKGAMRILVVQQLHNIIRELSQAFTMTAAKSAEFYKSIGLIQTITQDSTKSTKEWANSLRDLSSEFNIELLDASAAAYEAISNQIVNGNNALGFLAKSFEFAKITGSSAKDSVNLLSSAINGFALDASYTDEILAKMFKTIDVGRVTASQMANVLGNVAPTAHLAGVSMEELLAGIATLTREGVRVDTSMTLMNNIITSMIKPSEELAATIRSWGYESGQAAIQGLKFAGVLRKLMEEEQSGGAARLGELFPNIRSLRAMTGLGQDFESNYVKSLKEISEATDETAEASRLMGENAGVAFQKIQKSLSNIMVTRLGKEMMEIVVELDKDFDGLSNAIVPFVDAMSNVAHFAADTVMALEDVDVALNSLSFGLVSTSGIFTKLVPAVAAGTASYYALSPILTIISDKNTYLKSQLNNVLVANMSNVTWFKKAQVALMGYELNVHGAVVANKALSLSFSALALGIPAVIGGLAALMSYSYDVRRQIDDMQDEVVTSLSKVYERTIDNLTKSLHERNKIVTDGLANEMQTLKQYEAFVNRILNKGVNVVDRKLFGAELNDARNIDDTVNKLDTLKRIMQDIKNQGKNLTLLGDLDGANRAYSDLVKSAKDFNTELSRTSDRIKDSIEKLTSDKETSLLEKKLFGKEGAAKNKILAAEFEQLMDKAANAGNKEDALKFASKAQDIAGKMDSSGKDGTNKRFDMEVRAIELQLKLQEQLLSMLPEKIQQNTLLTEQEATEKRILDLKMQQRDAAAQIKQLQEDLNKELSKQTEKITEAEQRKNSLEGKIAGGAKQTNAAMGERAWGYLDPLSPSPRARAFSEMAPEFKDYVDRLETFMNDLIGARKSGDLKKAARMQSQLSQDGNIFDQLIAENEAATNPKNKIGLSFISDEEFQKEKDRRREMLQNMKDYAKEVAVINEATTRSTDVTNAIERARLETQAAMQEMGGLKDLYKDLWEEIGAGVNKPMRDLNDVVKELGVGVKSLKESLFGQMDAAGLQTRASGGRVGRDGTTAKFDPREFVMNPMASQQFGPQLAAMNSNFNGGGASSTSIVNIGDVHVHQSGGMSAGQSAADIGRALRREIKKGTVRLS